MSDSVTSVGDHDARVYPAHHRCPSAALSQLDVFIEYAAMPNTSDAEWMETHRNRPCIFRTASYLFSSAQYNQIGQLFVDGWKHDPGHLLLSCVGKLDTAPPVAAAAAAAPLRRTDAVSRGCAPTSTSDGDARRRHRRCGPNAEPNADESFNV